MLHCIGRNQSGELNCETFATESSTSGKTLLMLHYVLCTMFYVLCTMYYVLCTMFYILCTMQRIFQQFIDNREDAAAECTVEVNQHFNKDDLSSLGNRK